MTSLYPNNLKNRDSDLAKASGFGLPQSSPYCNMGSIEEVESRELSLTSETDFSNCLGIKTALVLSFSDLKRDPRVWRHLHYLKHQGYAVTAVGEEDPEIAGVEFISCKISENQGPIARWKWRGKRLVKTFFRMFDSIYWSHPKIKKVCSFMSHRSFDLILANDLDTLPLAVWNKKNAKLFFDAHEYAPQEFENILLWRLMIQPYRHFLCRKYLKKVDHCFTVCQGIADKYLQTFQVPFHVMINAASRRQMVPQPIVKGKIRMIYHGCATPSRSIEDVLAVMKLLDSRFELDMILVPGDSSYIENIKEKGKKISNLRFLNPVSMQEIVSFCNNYDIGFFPLKPTNFNYLFALPNKFFEFVQARIVPAVSPLSEMKRYIDHYQMGVVSADFTVDSFAQALNALDVEAIWKMKQNVHQAANVLCAEESYKLFDTLIKL